MKRCSVLIFIVCLITDSFLSKPAFAHRPSDAFLSVEETERGFSIRWDIAVNDMHLLTNLDANQDHQVTWGELQRKHEEIESLTREKLVLIRGVPCTLDRDVLHQVVERTGLPYLVMHLKAKCPETADALTLRYRFLFDYDQQHRAILTLTSKSGVQTGVLSVDQPEMEFDLRSFSVWASFGDFVSEGVWHIWIGIDHILFLVALIFPGVLVWRRRRWQVPARDHHAVMDLVKVITSFTLAHSITLSLVTLGFVSLPSRLVESVIAASVFIAAVNNFVPFDYGRRWLIAFGFGLIHGFGFASVLAELGLPKDALAAALLGFNVGVELGQLVILALVLPVLYGLRRFRWYTPLIHYGGSAIVMVISFGWMVDRIFDLGFMPF